MIWFNLIYNLSFSTQQWLVSRLWLPQIILCVSVCVCACVCLCLHIPSSLGIPHSLLSFTRWAAPPAADTPPAPIRAAALVFSICRNTVGQWLGVAGSHLTCAEGRVSWALGKMSTDERKLWPHLRGDPIPPSAVWGEKTRAFQEEYTVSVARH